MEGKKEEFPKANYFEGNGVEGQTPSNTPSNKLQGGICFDMSKLSNKLSSLQRADSSDEEECANKEEIEEADVNGNSDENTFYSSCCICSIRSSIKMKYIVYFRK